MKAPLGSSPSKQNQSQKSKGETASRQRNQGQLEDMLERVTGMAGGWGHCSQVLLNWKNITNATSLPDGSREC